MNRISEVYLTRQQCLVYVESRIVHGHDGRCCPGFRLGCEVNEITDRVGFSLMLTVTYNAVSPSRDNGEDQHPTALNTGQVQ